MKLNKRAKLEMEIQRLREENEQLRREVYELRQKTGPTFNFDRSSLHNIDHLSSQ